MKWKPAPDELIRRFGAATRDLPGIEPRKMFGYPCVFVNGNLFAGLFQDRMIVRLSESDRAGRRRFEPWPGRAMKEYVELEPAELRSASRLDALLRTSLCYAASLPAKKAKKAKRK